MNKLIVPSEDGAEVAEEPLGRVEAEQTDASQRGQREVEERLRHTDDLSVVLSEGPATRHSLASAHCSSHITSSCI